MRIFVGLAALASVLALSSSAAPSSSQIGDFPSASANCDMEFRVELDDTGRGYPVVSCSSLILCCELIESTGDDGWALNYCACEGDPPPDPYCCTLVQSTIFPGGSGRVIPKAIGDCPIPCQIGCNLAFFGDNPENPGHPPGTWEADCGLEGH